MKIKTIHIFDSEDDIPLGFNKDNIAILLDSEIVSDSKKKSFLKGESISQSDAILEAEKIYSSINIDNFSNKYKVWHKAISPQVILYIISKIIRCQKVLRRINNYYPGKKFVYTSNPIIKALSNKRYTKFNGNIKFYSKSIMIYYFSILFSKYRYFKLKSSGLKVKNKNIPKADILIHAENKVYQDICNKISNTLNKSHIVKVLVSNKKEKVGQVDINSFKDDNYSKNIRDVNKEVCSYFLIISALITKKLSHKTNFKIINDLIYKELFNWYIPMLSESYVMTKKILDISKPKIMIINDLTDMRARMFTLLSKEKNISVIYQQFGLQGYTDIQLKGNYADKYLLWGLAHKREFVNHHHVKESNIRITGSPLISEKINNKSRRKLIIREKKSILFPLIPSSPLTFGNGGATTTFQCRSIFKDIIECQKQNSADIELIVKPRPLRDHEWANPLIEENKNKIKILPHNMSINDALNNIDILITTHSTTGLDAFYHNIPLIIFNPFTEPDKNFYISNNLGFYVGNYKELNKTFKKIIDDENFLKELLELQNLELNNMMAFSGVESHKKVISNIEKHLKDNSDG